MIPSDIIGSDDARGRLADGKAGRAGDRGQQALEPLARPLPMRRQFGRDDRRIGMPRARMAGDQPDDPFGLGGSHRAGIDAALAQPVEPEPPSGLTMISTTSGSASAAAMAGPMAVRSMARRRSAEHRRLLMPPSVRGFGAGIGLLAICRPT
jgi:hypothetical protein